MTEHQIKGCQTLAEVEGYTLNKYAPEYGINAKEVNGQVWAEKWVPLENYLRDWNDMLRVSRIVFSTPVSEDNDFEQLVAREERFFTWVSLYNKSEAFSVLVEAAEWIKQQEK